MQRTLIPSVLHYALTALSQIKVQGNPSTNWMDSCDDIGCQKMKRRVVTSRAFICGPEILRCLFSFSGAGFWKVLSCAQSPPQQSCLPHLPSPGLTAAAAAAANAAIAEAMKVKKIKLEAMSSYHSNANHHGGDGENGDLSSSVGETHTNTLTKVASRYEFR